jgi:hypothetical protein
MEIRYFHARKPIILVRLLGWHRRVAIDPMILDTGADSTCFPASTATLIGHNNRGEGVEVASLSGIGGHVHSYYHTLELSLTDPSEPTIPIWTSSVKRFIFVPGFDQRLGLLGRDIMREWKRVAIVPQKKGWEIQIQV